MSKKKRFEIVYSQDRAWRPTEIWVDTQTGVQYLFHTTAGSAGGMCVLVDAEGKPLLYRRPVKGPEI